METQFAGLFELAFDKMTLLVAGAIFVFLRLIQKVPVISANGVYRRVLPLLPEFLGCTVSGFGGLPALEQHPIVIRIAGGLWCGFLAQKFHKVLGQTILGDDRVIKAATSPTKDPAEPPEEEQR